MVGQKRIQVLLVEDDPSDYQLLTRQLRSVGYDLDIQWAQTLTEASEQLATSTYDVVLTDLSLPECCGLETVAKLRRLANDLPIIVLTGIDDEALGQELLECGAQDYLVKGELNGRPTRRAIQHAIQRERMKNELARLLKEREEDQILLRQQAALLQKKNQRLRQLYQTGQEFVDNVSHDLRTPLTVIKDYVAIVREGMVGEVNLEQQQMLDKVSVRADDLNNMVDDLLDVSKLEAGLLGAWRRNVTISGIVRRVESMLTQRAQTRGVQLTYSCPDDLPDVYCDADMIGRVITNLVVNAIKFSGEKGEVSLWAKADPQQAWVVVGVTDNGPGMDASVVNKLFQRFRQADERVKTVGKGFGLGLSIASQLCRLNLGELTVESCLGEGSTFSFDIPAADPAEVLSRWLTTQRAEHDSLQLVEISIDDRAGASGSDDFDNFLNCLLRKRDLLFRVESGRWLLIMAIPECEAHHWRTRIRKEHQMQNRNRPMGPLPDYNGVVKASWRTVDQDGKILETFRKCLDNSCSQQVHNTALTAEPSICTGATP